MICLVTVLKPVEMAPLFGADKYRVFAGYGLRGVDRVLVRLVA